MSSTDDEPVIIDKAEATEEPEGEEETADNTSPATVAESEEEQPYPKRIVSIGNEEDAYAFTYDEDAFCEILAKVPPGWKVSVVSVVGAFRTGKSFLLSWFLRYLNYHHSKPSSSSSSSSSSSTATTADKWYFDFEKLDQSKGGFHWRGGVERDTTGIWMWSEPFFIEQPDNEQPLAVLLVDTQGLFDNETTMNLTSSIFGMSTLLSSYQIYNVDKRIQEDNLQHLALFSEYGRAALESKKETTEEDNGIKEERPFQRIEFLVRDWQHFECDGEGEIEDLEKEMQTYLNKVMEERDAKDLKETREQIQACFEQIFCFMLTHPGFQVTKKKYQGETDKVDPVFLRLLDVFCKRVFSLENLKPKKIFGRELTAVELGPFVKAYAKLFVSGAANFPEAHTMLDATVWANNTVATQESVGLYKRLMDDLAGPTVTTYVKQDELNEIHSTLREQALKVFDKRANFGNSKAIQQSRRQVVQDIDENWELFAKLNEGRNPLAGFEVVIMPLTIGIISFLLRHVTDASCSSWSQTCQRGSEILVEVYTIITLFLMIIASTKHKQISEMYSRVSGAASILLSGASQQTNNDNNNRHHQDVPSAPVRASSRASLAASIVEEMNKKED